MAVVTQPPGLVPWSDNVQFVRRHRAWISTFIGIGLALGYLWSLGHPPTFSATSSVALPPVPVYATASTTELVPPEVSIDTDAQLLQSPVVLGQVAQLLGTDEQSAGEHMSVTASPNSHVLHIRITASSATKAAAAADAAATALGEVRRHALGALRVSQLRQLRMILSNQEQGLARQQGAQQALPSEDGLSAEISQLRTGLRELETARAEPVEVISPSVSPKHADYANTEVPLVSGSMVGLLCGWLLGLARDRSTRRGRRPTERRPFRNPFGHLPRATTTYEDYDHAC